jgi:bifunctional DNA-binding transcriptional regulator/antitoxin component of YhaV-PrlF toxin-antitoxin module
LATTRKFAGKATLSGSRGQTLNVPQKAIEALGLAKGDVLLVYVKDGTIAMEPAEPGEKEVEASTV